MPARSTDEEEPPVIATGTSAVVTDQEVKAAIVGELGVLGVLVGELEELPPPQAKRVIGRTANMICLIIASDQKFIGELYKSYFLSPIGFYPHIHLR